MMKKLITTFLGLAVVSSLAFAQSFTITLNPGSLNTADGSTLTHSLQDSAGIGIYYAVGTNTAAGYASSFGTSTSVSASAFSALGGLTWTSLDQTSSGSFEFWTNTGWNGGAGSSVSAAGGETILIALTTGSSVGATDDTHSIGLLASSTTVGGLGQTNLGFPGQFSVIAGSTTGGLTMLSGTAIPEPSSYALLGGLLALGCVMLRRRA